LHSTCGAFAGYFKPRNVVAQLDRKVECRFGLAVLRPKSVVASPIGDPFWSSARTIPAAMPPSVRSTFTVIFAAAFSAATRAERGWVAAFKNRQRPIPDGFAQALEKLRSPAGIDAIGQPGDLAVAGYFEETLDRGEGFYPLDRIGFWRELAQRHARRAARHDRDVTRGLGQWNEGHAAPVAVGIRNQFVRGLDPGIPAIGSTPAVVEQNHERRAGAGQPGLRIPDRPRGRRMMRAAASRRKAVSHHGVRDGGLFLWRDIEQQPCRRKLDAARVAAASPATATTARAG